MLLLQQSVLQQLCRVELLSYDGKKGDKKKFLPRASAQFKSPV
jgi:hypothetical protein